MVVRVCCVRGSHYQVGLQIGKAFKRQIVEYFDRDDMVVKLLAQLQTDWGRDMYDYEGYLQVAKSVYPHYVDEIAGMAEGSGVPFEHVFLMHCRHEFTMATKDRGTTKQATGCTTSFLNVKDGPRIMAHNEDGHALIRELGYLVVAHIEPYEMPSGEVIPEESFCAFCYPGLLAGNAYGFNWHGLCISGNAQQAKCVEGKKILQRFVCRALLSAKSVDQAVDILRKDSVGMASGYAYNIVSTKDSSKEMYSVEVAPVEGEARNMVSVHITESGDMGSDCRYNHYNMYEHLDTPQWMAPSSEHRKARAAEMEKPSTKQDVVVFMGDTKDPDYPVFRRGTVKDAGVTATTGVFDLQEGVLEIYTGNPKEQKEPDALFFIPM